MAASRRNAKRPHARRARLRAFAVAALASLLALPLAQPACSPTRSAGLDPATHVVVPLDAMGATDYLVHATGHFFDSSCDAGPLCLLDFWAYEESNGREGLQRADELREDETCGAGPDRVVL